MTKITLSKPERDAAIDALQAYFDAELEREIGRFEAEFLLDFFLADIGPTIYNRALYDAQAVLSKRLDTISDAILELEQASAGQRAESPPRGKA